MRGSLGIAAVERGCALIRQSGKHPLILLLISGVAVVITTVGADLPRLH